MHADRHPLAGQQIKIKFKAPGHFQVEGLGHIIHDTELIKQEVPVE